MTLPPETPWLLAATVATALVVQSLRLGWQRGVPRRRLRAAALRGAAGEEDAAPLLERASYTIEARQAHARFAITVDGSALEVTVRADYLVSRRGRRFVAEVKTGASAPRPEHPATRRQLLEYRHAFDVDGVLLVDPEAGQVYEIEFPPTPSARPPSRLTWLLVGGAVGALATLAALI